MCRDTFKISEVSQHIQKKVSAEWKFRRHIRHFRYNADIFNSGINTSKLSHLYIIHLWTSSYLLYKCFVPKGAYIFGIVLWLAFLYLCTCASLVYCYLSLVHLWVGYCRIWACLWCHLILLLFSWPSNSSHHEELALNLVKGTVGFWVSWKVKQMAFHSTIASIEKRKMQIGT